MAPADTTKPAVSHADAVIDAVTQTFDDGCGVQLRPYTNREGEVDDGEVIVGIVSVGGQVGWSAFLALAETSAVAVSESFLGMAIPFDGPDMCEAICEVVNLFSVRIKGVLEQNDVEADVSMPKVLRAASIDSFIAQADPNEVKCFRSRSGKVWVGVFAAT